MKKNAVRISVAQVCYAVIFKNAHLSEAFKDKVPQQATTEQRSAIKALCFETLRHYVQLSDIWQQSVTKVPKDKLLRVIMSVALCEFIHHKKAAHVVVNEAINTAKALKKPWASGLINATLRKAIGAIDKKQITNTNDAAGYAHPQWWIDCLQHDWPEHWQAILMANNQKPPLWIRAAKSYEPTKKDEKHPFIDSAYKITPQDITSNQQFQQGLISVQDASAQLAAFIMQPQNGEKILDACAAPGGKTCHLLELNSNIKLDAIELYPNRAKKIDENLQRLKLSANVIIGDANQKNWFAPPQYDQILLDAPCSASGIVRRHPDIKFLRKPEDLAAICDDQQQLLANMAKVLAPNGRLLYATCSIFQQENSDQIRLFLKTHPEFSEITLKYSFAIQCEHGIQILPGRNNMDGFYYCYLKKNDV